MAVRKTFGVLTPLATFIIIWGRKYIILYASYEGDKQPKYHLKHLNEL